MIRLLEKNVAGKIAAGEVIERPISVVKELVENSIDAGSSDVVVEIKKGGTEYIRVTDDGMGIAEEEAELAFMRHATSKIEKAEDLDALTSLGFRGEALASIAAVSRTELITKTRDQKTGIKLSIEGSQVTYKEKVGCPDGTSIIVGDLFFNTPARRKFLKSQAAEAASIIEFVTRMALAYPDIKFRMINNDAILFATRGNGSRLDAIITVSGRKESSKLLEVYGESQGMKLTGFISGPGESRANRKEQIFFVNGRNVDSKVIEKGINKAYKERLFEGRYPICYLFIEVEPDTLDVNIHPNKREIRFDDNERVTEFIEETLKNALLSQDSIPEIAAGKIYEPAKSVIPEYKKEEKYSEQIDVKNILSTMRENENISHDSNIFVIETPSTYESNKIIEKETIKEPAPVIHKVLDFNELQVIGVLFETYILASLDDEFYLVDQHAAHERVFYEKLAVRMERRDTFSQEIMIPITFDCSWEGTDWIEPLLDFGYVIEPFGPGIYAARAIPDFFDQSGAETFLKDYVAALDDDIDFESRELKDMLATRACKSAVKGGDILSGPEISALMEDLSKCRNPYSCPHGRPTFIKMSRYEIEKRFKRV